MRLKIDSGKKVRKLHNFWNNIHFHPTDAIEDEWGQRILNRVQEDHAAKTVRMFTMMEDIVTMSEDGRLQYDFTENDLRMDYMAGKGFTILLCYNFIPACIARNPDERSSNNKNARRYKGKLIITSPPKDYALWEEICRTYTAHIAERYGLERVSGWYLHCYNEPDIPAFWMKEEEDIQVRCREYCHLYDAFERGVRAVSDRLRLGGPVLACRMDFMEGFLKHARDSKKKLDFLSFHAYGTKPWYLNNGELPISAANSVEKIRECKALAEKYGFGEIPLIIDEWGASSGGYCNCEDCPGLIFRENEVFSAFFVKMLTLYEELQLPIEKMMICLSGQHEMKTDFSGFRGFFTLHFYPKPIYNAFVLSAKLGEYKTACNIPEDGNLSVLPTIAADGRVAVLLAYASEHFDAGLSDLHLELEFAGLSGGREAKLWYIDREHANSYRMYQRLGAPDEPAPEQIEQIAAAGELVCESRRFTDVLEAVMEDNSVLLVEIMPEREEGGIKVNPFDKTAHLVY